MFHSDSERSPARRSREKAEETGVKFATAAGAKSIAKLRAKPAADLLNLSLGDPTFSFNVVIDGAVLPEDANAIFAAGRQSDIPLLAGSTADEDQVYKIFGSKRPTAESFRTSVKQKYADRTDVLLKLYPATTDEEAVRSAGDLEVD